MMYGCGPMHISTTAMRVEHQDGWLAELMVCIRLIWLVFWVLFTDQLFRRMVSNS